MPEWSMPRLTISRRAADTVVLYGALTVAALLITVYTIILGMRGPSAGVRPWMPTGAVTVPGYLDAKGRRIPSGYIANDAEPVFEIIRSRF
jgi:hypothetical protein